MQQLQGCPLTESADSEHLPHARRTVAGCSQEVEIVAMSDVAVLWLYLAVRRHWN